MAKKWVYLFDELDQAASYVGGSWEGVRGLMGGKGANLADMTRLGLPVPPGFTVTTEACNAYLAEGNKFPEQLWEQELAALAEVENKTGKKFGDSKRPLLVSCRSGAKFSMPGMMDTVLNIGLNDETVQGMIDATGDPRFVYDSYRRLIQMFGSVVMGVPDEPFEEVIAKFCKARGVKSDTELSTDDWKAVGDKFKDIFHHYSHMAFPSDPLQQLHLATEAVFRSWNGKRAIDYREAAKIAHDLGTAVNIVTMVFGNMGQSSATGVATTRNVTNGEKKIDGDFLINAQGEDVVAGIRKTLKIGQMADAMPDAWNELAQICANLEQHYRDTQDIEFTVEQGKLWMLQTRDAKRTAQAAVRIAVDMVEEGLITREEAVGKRVTTEQVDFFLHPQFNIESKEAAKSEGRLLASGLNVSPGAAVGMVAFTADLAESWAKKEDKKEDKKGVIMVRPFTKPDDVHGMLAAQGILTSRGGSTSHAALVARQYGKPAVVGVAELEIDLGRSLMAVGSQVINEGDWVSIDGTTGEVFLGELKTFKPDMSDPWLRKLLQWADGYSRLQVWTNADYPHDAKRAREFGAMGIGLCRTEHMFFEKERLPLVRKLIMTDDPAERREALDALLPYQREDFSGLFREMDGLPVIIRLLDPPLHEFLQSHEELASENADIKFRLSHSVSMEEQGDLLRKRDENERKRRRVESLREANPMLGLRGVRLGIMMPELTQMQVRAIFEAACQCAKDGVEVHPEIMIPLVAHVNELTTQREALEMVAKEVMEDLSITIDYKFGTMIEVPRAALTADEIAEHAEFFSFGTNDLTQMVFGISRDDAEKGFLGNYLEDKMHIDEKELAEFIRPHLTNLGSRAFYEQGAVEVLQTAVESARGNSKNKRPVGIFRKQSRILSENPFVSIDEHGVAKIMRMAVELGRKTRPGLEVGICGEHGGDPKSIAICHNLGLNYVSCSPFRVPIARLAAAQVALKERSRELGTEAAGKKASGA